MTIKIHTHTKLFFLICIGQKEKQLKISVVIIDIVGSTFVLQLLFFDVFRLFRLGRNNSLRQRFQLNANFSVGPEIRVADNIEPQLQSLGNVGHKNQKCALDWTWTWRGRWFDEATW